MAYTEKWEGSWGDGYDLGEKAFKFRSLFNDMFENGRLGENVVDVGSGMYPVTSHLPEGLDARVVALDCVGGDVIYGDGRLKLQFDLDDIDNVARVREAVSKVAPFLRVDNCDSLRHVDCFVFSEILHYVDYKEVLRFFAKYLCAGGRFVINERLGRAYYDRCSPRGYEGFPSLYEFLEKEGFVIEQGPEIGDGFSNVIVARLDV